MGSPSSSSLAAAGLVVRRFFLSFLSPPLALRLAFGASDVNSSGTESSSESSESSSLPAAPASCGREASTSGLYLRRWTGGRADERVGTVIVRARRPLWSGRGAAGRRPEPELAPRELPRRACRAAVSGLTTGWSRLKSSTLVLERVERPMMMVLLAESVVRGW